MQISKTSTANSVVHKEFFVDREAQTETFSNTLNKLQSNRGTVMYYAGTGGIGKSALIQKLEKFLISKIDDETEKFKYGKFKYVSYDFATESSVEMLTVLTALWKKLSEYYQVKFPFFEEGLLSYYHKRDDFAGLLNLENSSQGNTFFRNALNHLYTANSVGSVSKILFNGTSGLLDVVSGSIPFVQVAKECFHVAAKGIEEFQKIRLEHQPAYRSIVDELRKREFESDPDAVKEYLPTLFAKDVSYWLLENNLTLVIFLDTYEQLTGDENNSKRHEKLIYAKRDAPVDWWIEDLISNAGERVLWVIAGRSRVATIGRKVKVIEGENLYNLEVLPENFADEFLKKAGIADKDLRDGIVKLTGGYPIYLSLCVDVYNEKQVKPKLADFGAKSEEVIRRLLEFVDEQTRKIIKRLCVLGRWTEFYLQRVLTILHEYNFDTYERIKKLSFVSEQNENFFEQSEQSEKIFFFDRSVREILFPYLMEKEKIFVDSTIDAVNKFFQNVFAMKNRSVKYEDRVLFFKLWADFILSTTGDAQSLMDRYAENLAPISNNFDDVIIEGVIVQFHDKVAKIFKKNNPTDEERMAYAYFEHLIAQIEFSQGNDKHALELAKNSYEKIVRELNKNSMTAGQYSLALFHAMSADEDAEDCKDFTKNFKAPFRSMKIDEKELILENYGRLLKILLNMYRDFEKVITLADKTIAFVGDGVWLGKCSDTFVEDLQLYKSAANNHLGKVEDFSPTFKANCLKAVQKAIDAKDVEKLNQCIIVANLKVVNLQDAFNYQESLELGQEVIYLLLDSRLDSEVYKDQYYRLCGSLALTCYLTLNSFDKNLELARGYSDIAINGFDIPNEKIHPYQTRAQIEAEVGNFDLACDMLDKGLNITIRNLTSDQMKDFSAFQWYHFAKFVERLLKSSDVKFFEIAKRALEVALREENFLNYRKEVGDNLAYPAYITFSKMATCFDILGDTEQAINLHEAALRGVSSIIGEDNSSNSVHAAFRLVMMAGALLTLEKNSFADKAKDLSEKLQKNLDEYLDKVQMDSMKIPFDGWHEMIDDMEKNSADKFDLLEKMSRAILYP